jgi:hypothetical protein
MKIIAIEEAFSVPEMAAKGAALNRPSHFRAGVLENWERRLPDIADLRLKRRT